MHQANAASDKLLHMGQAVARRVPAALLVVLVGLVVAAVQNPHVFQDLHLGPTVPTLTLPTWQEWKTGDPDSSDSTSRDASPWFCLIVCVLCLWKLCLHAPAWQADMGTSGAGSVCVSAARPPLLHAGSR